MKRAVALAAWVAVLAAAAWLRLADLDNRPMHCDEAVHAIKFGELLERHRYIYNPHEYHGPSLNFFTLPVAWLASADKLTEVSERQLRLVPALSGIALVALIWLSREELGHRGAFCAAVLTAVSPAMVFYSRYYIQEMLLVGATFGAIVALWRFARDESGGGVEAGRRWKLRRACWLIFFAVCVGVMHASKETCVIALFAMALAAAVTLRRLRHLGRKRLALASLAAGLIAATVSALLFSSLLGNPQGIIDSYTTYVHYFDRVGGEGSAGRHVYPWHYYFRILFWWQRGNGPLWTEASIAVLAAIGAAAGILGKTSEDRDKRSRHSPCGTADGTRSVPATLTAEKMGTVPFEGPTGTVPIFSRLRSVPAALMADPGPVRLAAVRFLILYVVVMTAVYAAIPYKTPWCALGFFHGMIVLAGVGAAFLVETAKGHAFKGLVVLILALAAGHLAWQAQRASFSACADPDNPYVYAHTTADIPRLARRIEQLVGSHSARRDEYVQVICPDDDYWPLPWYLRRCTKVGWFRAMPHGPPAPVIVIQPSLLPALLKYLYEDQPPGQRHLYMPLSRGQDRDDWLLRPHVPLEVYLRRDWAIQQGTCRVPDSTP